MFSIPYILDNLNSDLKNKIAFVDEERSITFGQLRIEVLNMSQVFSQIGINKGDRVGICMNKSIEQVVVILATIYSNSIFVPILPNLKHDNIDHIISDSGLDFIMTESSRVSEIKKFKDKVNLFNVRGSGINGIKSLGDIKTLGKSRESHFNCISDEIAGIIYSSGSTGRPKGIMLSHKNLYEGARIVSHYLNTTQDDKIIAVLSFNFDYGLNQIWQTIYKGATLFLYNLLLPNDFFSYIEKNKITAIPLMPIIINRIFDKRLFNKKFSYNLSKVKYVCTSGGKISESMLKELKSNFSFSKIYLMYGLTEAFRSTFLDPDQIEIRPNSIGKAIPETKIYILNEKGEECAPGEIGELVHRGGCISKGYWNDKAKTDQRFRQLDRFPGERVVFSGDLVKRDADGYLYFISRKDKLLKNSGMRISPNEIEETVEKNELIDLSVVFGKENIKVGHDIILAYTTVDKKPIEKAILKSYLKNKLPFYMYPKYIFHLNEFPITGNEGKIDRVSVQNYIADKIKLDNEKN